MRRSRPTWLPGGRCGPTTWQHLLGESGYDATVADGPDGADYLVIAVRATVPLPEPTPAR